MEEIKSFTYSYSAAQNKEVENIREKYIPREVSKLELLRSLDNRVKTAGMIQALSLGIVGCLLFGVGMCFWLGALSGPGWLAVLCGILGSAVMLPAYPVYKKISNETKEKLTPEILRLADEILE